MNTENLTAQFIDQAKKIEYLAAMMVSAAFVKVTATAARLEDLTAALEEATADHKRAIEQQKEALEFYEFSDSAQRDSFVFDPAKITMGVVKGWVQSEKSKGNLPASFTRERDRVYQASVLGSMLTLPQLQELHSYLLNNSTICDPAPSTNVSLMSIKNIFMLEDIYL